MEKLVIGCRTLEKELLEAMAQCKKSYDIVWVEAHLHNVKSHLKDRLQEILKNAGRYDTVLFATGFCGNSIEGLRSLSAPLVIPRVDDCTSLLLGGHKNKLDWLDSYFLTEGWLKSDRTIWNEYTYALKKYGDVRGNRIFHALFSHYKRIALLDTGCYDIDASLPAAEKIASAFSLSCQVVPAGISYLKDLLDGLWDEERFLIVPPHTAIAASSLSSVY